jgi:hypothetical protein
MFGSPVRPSVGLSTCEDANDGRGDAGGSERHITELRSCRDVVGGGGSHGRRGSEPKPWRGPLPKQRSSPCMSLGDVWVKDRRSEGFNLGGRLGEVLSPVRRGGEPPAGEPTEKTSSCCAAADSVRRNFEFGQQKTVGFPGLGWTRGLGRVKGGTGPLVRGASGLGLLFRRGGNRRVYRRLAILPPLGRSVRILWLTRVDRRRLAERKRR